MDFDGTLTDYAKAHRLGVAALQSNYLLHVAVEVLDEASDAIRTEYYKRSAVHGPGGGLDAFLVERLFAQFETLPDRGAVDCYRDAVRAATVAAPGAHDLLGGLSMRGRRVAVVTNAYDAEPQRRRVEVTGLSEHLDALVIAIEVGRFKPDPGLFLNAARRLGVTASDCAVVGDSVELDMAPARAAGMTSVLVAPVDHPIADAWVPNLSMLCAALTGPGSRRGDAD